MAAAATGFIPCFRTVSIRVLQVSREPNFAEALQMTTLLRRCGALAPSHMPVIPPMESPQKWKRSRFGEFRDLGIPHRKIGAEGIRKNEYRPARRACKGVVNFGAIRLDERHGKSVITRRRHAKGFRDGACGGFE